jgi:lipid II:glycine glycyltransferase (peptidoglycan interpeptide bridge formation enzyme)
MEAVFDCIEQASRQNRFLLLSIQPPADEAVYMSPIKARELTPSAFYVVPPTTVLVNLQQSEDEILTQMKQKTRYNIRLASRKDVTIREGSEADLPAFYRFMQITGARSDYVHYDLDYYQEAWRQFAPRGLMKLWIAYYRDEPLGALIVIAFGRWAVYKWGGSSDTHRNRMPNHLLQWTAIRWSKVKGCYYYDLGGITPASVADALKRGEEPHTLTHKEAGIARFKFGFGDIVTFPDAFNDYGMRPKWLMRTAAAYAGKLDGLRALVLGGTSIWKQKVAGLQDGLLSHNLAKTSLQREE